MTQSARAVIVGAGIAGAAAAYFLTVRHGLTDVAVVEQGDPLSLTSDKSSECYRNWWPGPGSAMVDLTNRSIDLLEELSEGSGERFRMNRRGYAFATAAPGIAESLRQEAEDGEDQGGKQRPRLAPRVAQGEEEEEEGHQGPVHGKPQGQKPKPRQHPHPGGVPQGAWGERPRARRPQGEAARLELLLEPL